MKKLFSTLLMMIVILSTEITGQGWQWIDTGYPFIILDFCFPPGQSDIGYAVGSSTTFNGDGIILKTTDGGFTWSQISVGTIPGLEAVCFTSVDVGYAGGWQNYFIKTTDGGNSWTPYVIGSKLWYFNNIEFYDANNGIVVSYPSSVYVTTDAGNTWTFAIGIKHTVEDICYADANTLYLVGANESIAKSTNGGLYWIDIYSGVIQTLFLGVEFYDSNFGIVSGEDGKVLVTTNGGSSWNVSNAGGSGLMNGIHIMNENTAYVAGTPEQVFKTTDGGNNWISDFNGASTVALYKIKFTENNTGLICGSQGKFLINTDYVPVELISFNASADDDNIILNWSTATELNNFGFDIERASSSTTPSQGGWKKIGFIPGIGNSSHRQNYSFTDNELEPGTYSYRLKQIDLDGNYEYSEAVEVELTGKLNYVLLQNYPNPFNPATNLQYVIGRRQFVSLKVFDLLGKEVATLVNEEKHAGSYEIKFDGSSLTSGIYIVQMVSGRYNEQRKMLLIK